MGGNYACLIGGMRQEEYLSLTSWNFYEALSMVNS